VLDQTVPVPVAGARPQAVFILGVTQRSGTHFLYDLLLQHPDCRAALSSTSWEGSWEDNLLRFSEHLEAYAREIRTSNRLSPQDTEDRLLRALGRGLLEHLRRLDEAVGDEDGRTVVTKTPMMRGLPVLPRLLPDVPAVLLVRDPRAVVESAVRTFGRSVDEWALAWRAGARAALTFESAHPEAGVLVRYEDLCLALEPTLADLLVRLRLNPGRYDFSVASRLPVRGSSELGGERRRITWEPRARTPAFDPVHRGDRLDEVSLDRLRWLAAPEMKALGYWRHDDHRPRGWAGAVHAGRDWARRGRTAVVLGAGATRGVVDRVRGSATAP
jgi:hypothetical protein